MTGAIPYVEEALRWLPDDAGSGELPELPTRDEGLPIPAVSLFSEGDDQRPYILVADDNADMRQYVVRLLEERYHVRAVPDGDAAMAALRERTPDLVLTDVMMPRLDGFGLLSAIRSEASTRSLPVIMLSARAGEESRVEGMEAGADDYLVKPFSARELQARVGARIEIARVRRESERAVLEREQRLSIVQDQAPVGICEKDIEGRFLRVNDRFCEITGFSREELLQRRFQDITHPDDIQADIDHYRRLQS
jgi:DNA-binding response OmpR family regulator